jgi:hypothetical protein
MISLVYENYSLFPENQHGALSFVCVWDRQWGGGHLNSNPEPHECYSRALHVATPALLLSFLIPESV